MKKDELIRFLSRKPVMIAPARQIPSLSSIYDTPQERIAGNVSYLFQVVQCFQFGQQMGQQLEIVREFIRRNPLELVRQWIFLTKKDLIWKMNELMALKILDMIENVLELIRFSDLKRQTDLRYLKCIMGDLEFLFQKSTDNFFKNEYMEILFQNYLLNPQGYNIYAIVEKVESNMQFIVPYFQIVKGLMGGIYPISQLLFDLLLKGFMKRVEFFFRGNNDEEMQEIAICYSCIIHWAESQQIIDTSCVRKLFDNKLFISQIVMFECQFKYGANLNSFIRMLNKSSIPPCLKFNCILNDVIKVILEDSCDILNRLHEEELVEEGCEFPKWFVEAQMTVSKALEFMKCFGAQLPGVRFVWKMIAAFVTDYPNKQELVKDFVKMTGFIHEIRFYLGDPLVQKLLQIYYDVIEEPRGYEEVLDIVQDMKIRRKL